MDRDLTLLECGKASYGFFGIINWINERRLNIPLYKIIFKSQIQIMSNDTFLKIQDQMKELYDFYD